LGGVLSFSDGTFQFFLGLLRDQKTEAMTAKMEREDGASDNHRP